MCWVRIGRIIGSCNESIGYREMELGTFRIRDIQSREKDKSGIGKIDSKGELIFGRNCVAVGECPEGIIYTTANGTLYLMDSEHVNESLKGRMVAVPYVNYIENLANCQKEHACILCDRKPVMKSRYFKGLYYSDMIPEINTAELKEAERSYNTKAKMLGMNTFGFEKAEITNSSVVEMPGYIKVLYCYSFNSSGLTVDRLHISDGIIRIGENWCSLLSIGELEISGTCEYIDVNAFKGLGIQKLILHEGIRHLGMYAFKGNNIRHVVIPRSLNSASRLFRYDLVSAFEGDYDITFEIPHEKAEQFYADMAKSDRKVTVKEY